MCDLLLVINSNLGHIFYRFRHITTKKSEIVFTQPGQMFSFAKMPH